MKKLVLFALIFSLLLTGCASGVSQEEYDAVVAERDEAIAQLEAMKNQMGIQENTEVNATIAPSTENIADLLDIEAVQWHQHFINADYYHYDLIVTNNSQQLVEAQFTIKFFDASGNVIGVSNVSTEALSAGASHFLTARNESPFDHAEVSVTSAYVDDRYNGGMENVVCNDYAVNGEKVIFEVTNNGDAAVAFVYAYVLFYNGNEVVDCGQAYAIDADNELKPGATLIAEVSTNKSFTSYRIFYYGRIV